MASGKPYDATAWRVLASEVRSIMPRVFFPQPTGILLPSPIPQMSRHIHGLMQDPDHEDRGAIELVERKVAAGDQLPASRQEVRTVSSDPRIVEQSVQGMVDIVKISVRLVGSPLTECLRPDFDEIGSGGLAEPYLTRHPHQTWPVPRV